MDLKIEFDYLETFLALDKLQNKDLVQGTRKAMNRTLLTLRQESINKITDKIKIKPKTLREKHIALSKAQGGSIEALEASIDFSSDPVPLIEFVKGSKDVIQQKGIPVKRRRKLRVEITPGKKFVMKGAFIQRKSSKQVFKGRRTQGFKKQGIRSIGFLILHRGIGERLVELGGQRFQELLMNELTTRMNGIIKSADIK